MKKILVIEDDEALRATLLEMLGTVGYHVIGTSNGKLGYNLAQEEKPSLILCDVMLPEMNGFEILSRIRHNSETSLMPFIFLTAKSGNEDIRQGMNLGADDYLTKPFALNDLLKAIESRLAKQDTISSQSQERIQGFQHTLTHTLPQEFLSPLSTILNSSENLLKYHATLKQEQVLELGKRINTNATKLQRLIQNFLLYSQLEVMASNPDKTKGLWNGKITSAKKVITDTCQEIARDYGRESDLVLELQEATAHITDSKLRKIIEEILDNAFKYSQPGTTVRVRTLTQGNMLMIYVMDNGKGITPEQLARLSDYANLDKKLGEQQGSGLGLAIVRRLVDMHGGDLKIESFPGMKTIIRIFLPTGSPSIR